jgi:hypothetical protein
METIMQKNVLNCFCRDRRSTKVDKRIERSSSYGRIRIGIGIAHVRLLLRVTQESCAVMRTTVTWGASP